MVRKVTIKDIAREAGVSPALVSFVFNGKNRVGEASRKKILEVALRLGYRTPAPDTGEWPAAHLLGAVLPEIAPEALQRLQDAAYRLGYALVFASAGNDPVRFCYLVRALLQQGVEGLVFQPVPTEEETCLQAVQQGGVPSVLLGPRPETCIEELIRTLSL